MTGGNAMNKIKIRKLGNYLLDAQARLSAVRRDCTSIELLPAIDDINQSIELLKELDECDS